MGVARKALDVNAGTVRDLLGVFLAQIGSAAPELIFGVPEGVAHHYTDLSGLAGIISNSDLWLTHSRYSNDDEEMKHGFRVAREQIAAGRANRSDQDYLQYLDEV